MFKINKSILMVCLISIFLLASQASAADSNISADIKSIDENMIVNCNSIDSLVDEGNKMNGFFFLFKNNIINSPTNDNSTLKSLINKNQSSKNSNDLDNNGNLNDDSKGKNTEGIVMAEDGFSCGPASLATALNKLGMNLSLSEVSAHTNTSEENGTSMQSLIDAARHYNFSAIGVKINSSGLRENSIAHINLDGRDHWTVVSKVIGNQIFLADSTEGNINMSLDEFNSLFSGNAIFLSKINETNLKQEISNKNISILEKNQCSTISGKGWMRVIVGYRTEWRWGSFTKYSWVLRPKVVGGHVSFSQWEYVYVGRPVWKKYKVKIPIYKWKYSKIHINSKKYV